MSIMRLASVILLAVAIVLGTVAIRSYREDSRKRDDALGELLVLPLESPLKFSLMGEVADYDSKMRNDEVLGLVAAILLINSLSMLSRAGGGKPNRRGPLA